MGESAGLEMIFSGSVIYALVFCYKRGSVIKIGCTKQLKKRKMFLGAGSIHKPRLIGSRPGNYLCEQWVIRALYPYKTEGGREYFHAVPAVDEFLKAMFSPFFEWPDEALTWQWPPFTPTSIYPRPHQRPAYTAPLEAEGQQYRIGLLA